MCRSQQSLVDLLKNEFKSDLLLEESCKSNAKKALQQGMATRFFEKFPDIISQNELKILVDQCKIILTDVDSESIVEQGKQFIFTEDDDRNRMFEWQMRIIEKGARELLDQNADVKLEFLNLLGLKNFKIAPNEILCSYVGIINQYITHYFEKYANHLVQNNQHVYNMIFYYVNKHYGNWTRLWLHTFEKIHEIASSENLQSYLKNLQCLSLKLNSRKYLTEQEKNEIYTLQKKIINSAISQALDEEGQINPAFFKKIEMKPFDIPAKELVSIYVNVINHYLLRIMEAFPENRSALIFEYINKHNTLWIEDELPHTDYVLVTPKELLNWPKKNPSPGILLVLAAITTITTASAGYMFFKNSPKNESKPDLKGDNKLFLTF